MPDKSNNPTQLWQELKRRKVFRVIAMYVAAAYVIIELSNNVVEPLSLPEWTTTLIIVFLLIGFPFAVIISWVFDITPEGIKKTESTKVAKQKETPLMPQKRKLGLSDVIIAVLLVVVVILAYPKIFKKDKFENIKDADGRISIAVMPFDNSTGDSLYNTQRAGIQNILITKLSNSEELSVRKLQTEFDIFESTGHTYNASITPSIARDIALELKTSTFIIGDILKASNKIRVIAQLRDSKTEEIYKSFQVDGDTEDDFLNIIDSLSNLIKNHLEIKVFEQDANYDLASIIFTNSSEAYRYYLEANDSYDNLLYESAIDYLSKAIKADSSFFAAYDLLIDAYASNGQIENARLILNKLKDWDIDKLSRIEQLSQKMTIADRVDKNMFEYIKNCKLILNYDPQLRMFWYYLGEAYLVLEQYENAINAHEKGIEVSKQWGINDTWVVRGYTQCGWAYHKLGNHQKEKKIYETGLNLFPNNKSILSQQYVCALSQGDKNNYTPSGTNESGLSEGGINHGYGHLYAEANLFDEAAEYFRKGIQLEPQLPYHRLCLVEGVLMRNDNNVEEVMELVNKILELTQNDIIHNHYKKTIRALYCKAWVLYKQGNHEQALEILYENWDKEFSYNHGHYLFIQEVEQALASQNQ